MAEEAKPPELPPTEELQARFGVFHTMRLWSHVGQRLAGLTGRDFRRGFVTLLPHYAKQYPIEAYYTELKTGEPWPFEEVVIAEAVDGRIERIQARRARLVKKGKREPPRLGEELDGLKELSARLKKGG